MKCTNKLCAILMGAVLVFQAGCGSGVEELSRPYDIYETTAGVGLAASKNAEEKTFFSDGLCVADDVAIGTEDTDSYVAGGAAAFNVATGEVVYAKNLYTKLYPASTTKVLTAYIVLKYAADLDETVTVSENAADQEADSSVCGVSMICTCFLTKQLKTKRLFSLYRQNPMIPHTPTRRAIPSSIPGRIQTNISRGTRRLPKDLP